MRNVLIQLCSLECCQMHAFDDPDCPLNPPFMDDMRAWAERTDKICYWIYVTNFDNYLLPCPNLGTLGRNLRVLRKNGVIGVMQQGPYDAEGADFPELKNYVLARLLWDPEQDEAKLVREFVGLYYGGSAQGVMAILDRIEHMPPADRHRHFFGTAADYGFTPEHGRELVLMFHELISRETNPDVRSRLEKAAICAWRVLAEPWWPASRPEGENRPKPAAELDGKVYKAFGVVRDQVLPGPVAATLQLCVRHGLKHTSEGRSLEGIAEKMAITSGE